ncbi:MAG: endonuclease/exonuclease/phosphatase family protein [Chloroflexota bacterium]
MKLLTYNIHHWEGADGQVDVARVTEVIRASGADIVALNEVFHPVAPESDGPPLLERMAHDLGMRYVFGETVSFYPQAGFPAPYGNALLTRLPLLSAEAHLTIDLPGRERRGFLRAVLDTNSTPPLTVYVTHLDHRHESARLAQVDSLLDMAARFDEPLHLILGDLNALAPSDASRLPDALKSGREVVWGGQVIPRLLQAGYVDAFAAAGHGPGETWPTDTPQARIDYGFLSPALAARLHRCQRWQLPPAEAASDHFAVLIELTP